MCFPVVVVPDVVWHHHLPIHLLHGFLLLLLAVEEILVVSAGHSGVVTSRDGGHCRTRGFECWLPNNFLKVSFLKAFLVSVEIDADMVSLFS